MGNELTTNVHGIRDVWITKLYYDQKKKMLELPTCICTISMNDDGTNKKDMGKLIHEKINDLADEMSVVEWGDKHTCPDFIILPPVLLVEVAYTTKNKELIEDKIEIKDKRIVESWTDIKKINDKSSPICYELKGYTNYTG